MVSDVVASVKWIASTKTLGQLFQWAMTIVAVRFLQPSDYGLMAIAIAFVGFFQSIGTVGLVDAMVQATKLESEREGHLFGLLLLTGGVCAGTLNGLAYIVSTLYGNSELFYIMLLMSTSVMFTAVASMSDAKLRRELAFKETSRIDLLASLVNGIVVVSLAWVGLGVWSLVVGTLAASALRATALLMLAPPRRIPTLTIRGERRLLKAGVYRTAEHVLWYLSSNVDVLLVGKLAGSDSAGIYSVARTIAALPVQKIALVIRPLGIPTFAKLQSNHQLARYYLERVMAMVALVSLPIFFGVAVTSKEFVAVILGSKWEDAALPISILAVGMALRPAGLVVPSFLMGLGEFRATLTNTGVGAVLLTVAYAIGSLGGIVGICVGASLGYQVQFWLLLSRAARVSGGSTWGLLRPVLGPLGCAVAMLIMLAAGRTWIADDWSAALRIAVLGIAGALVYAMLVALFCRPILRDIYTVIFQKGG
ncbi:MAG: lipopolysaccharide biosynthesis protein [Geminicoccaceae bacterium]